MTVQTWLAFVAASTVALALPGPTALIILRYAAQPDRSALPFVVGGPFWATPSR